MVQRPASEDEQPAESDPSDDGGRGIMALLSGGSKLFFAAAATALMALAAALLVTSAHRWATAALRGQELLHQTLECIGLVTIAIAVFEVWQVHRRGGAGP